MSFHLISFYYKVDEMLEELNSSLQQLDYGKIDFVMCHFAAVPKPIDNLKQRFTVFKDAGYFSGY